MAIETHGGLTRNAKPAVFGTGATTDYLDGTGAPVNLATSIGSVTAGATAKTTPADADSVGLSDSAASNVLKKFTWASLKAAVKSYLESASFTYLSVIATAFSGREILARWSVSDASRDFVTLSNGTVSAGQFLPTFFGAKESDARAAVLFRGTTNVSNDIGSNALIAFEATLYPDGSADPVNATFIALATRPILSVGVAGATPVFFVWPSGRVGVGLSSSPVAKLQVRDTGEQLRVEYDGSNSLSIAVGATGLVTVAATGSGAAISFGSQIRHTLPTKLAAYTLATLPSASTYVQGLIYVSDGTSNKRLAISDGTNWRWPDGAIVS